MATRNVILSIGSGPDQVSTKGSMQVRRVYRGPDGDGVLIFDVVEVVEWDGAPASEALEVGQYYVFTPVDPKGDPITANIPAGAGDILISELVPVNPRTLEPSAEAPPAWFVDLQQVQAALAEKQDKSALDEDSALLVDTPGSELDTAITAKIEAALAAGDFATAATLSAGLYGKADKIGAGVARFIQRMRSGENVAISALGDSILEGNTVTDPLTDGCMILLAADLSTRFGVTVTKTNHAVSGQTAFRSHLEGNVAAAVADNADLYIVSAFDKNDIGADTGSPYAPGYPLAQSLASIERMVRTIRSSVAKADIIIMATNPYKVGSVSAGSFAAQIAKDKAVRRIAAAYGCEFVDAYQPFIDYGNYAPLMLDSTHPNTLGHRLIADTLLAHFANVDHVTSQPGNVATTGLYHPELVDVAKPRYGYILRASPGVGSEGITFAVNGAGWSTVGSTDQTSTAGNYMEITATASEFFLQCSTNLVDAAVVDVAVDGVTVTAGLDLTTVGKNGDYWITIARGLSENVQHVVRITLVSGTLKAYSTSALQSKAASSFTPSAKEVLVQTNPSTVALLTTNTTVFASATIPLPAGWAGMSVAFRGKMPLRTGTSGTTGDRLVTASLRVAAATIGTSYRQTVKQVASRQYANIDIQGQYLNATAGIAVDLVATLDVADSIDVPAAFGFLYATLTRTA